jgi:hypothetical protein
MALGGTSKVIMDPAFACPLPGIVAFLQRFPQ